MTPAHVVSVADRARRAGLSMVFVHTHPKSPGIPIFSETDDRGERRLADFFDTRSIVGPHLALVVGPGGCRCRVLGGDAEIEVVEIGSKLESLFVPSDDQAAEQKFDRQIRAFGQSGQKSIQRLTIAIVGLGGTGSAIAQQVAHLGVRNFILIDPDVIETHNLNRLIGATISDVGAAKVAVASRQVSAINPGSTIQQISGDIRDANAARALLAADFIFCCTDSHASRAIVSQVAYQYLIPCVDMGVGIHVNGSEIEYIVGRVQLLSPGQACLICTNSLNSKTIREELLSEEERRVDAYIVGANEPQPAVVSLNSTVASLAVTMFLGVVTQAPAGAKLQFYDAMNGTVRAPQAARVQNCVVCSPHGALARGDSWRLPFRAHRQ